MTLRQYLYHFRQWLRMFPLPREESHLWIGVVGERELQCWCGAKKDDDLTDEELERDKLMNDEWTEIREKVLHDRSETWEELSHL